MVNSFNSILILMLIVVLTVGCQSTQNNQSQLSDKVPQSDKPSMDFNLQIEQKYWKLISLNGKPVSKTDNQNGDIHFKLNAVEKTLNGFAGCNSFFGGYELKEGMRIKFSSLGSTLKACLDGGFDEQALLKALDLTDNYTLSKDSKYNDILQLNVGRRAPLAVFKAVYFE